MSAFVAEQIRSSHALVEQLQDTCTTHLVRAADTSLAPLDRLAHEHEARRLMEEMRQQMRHTLSLYSDDSSLMAQQLAAIEGDGTWTSFYDTLGTLRLQANKLPPPAQPSPAASSQVPVSALPAFTAEESNGRHVDLHAHHARFLALPFHPRLDYATYLQAFSASHTVPRERKVKSFHSAAYTAYIAELLDYWRQYGRRLHPLLQWDGAADSDSIEGEMRKEFEVEWRERRVKGWFEIDGGGGGDDSADSRAADNGQNAARADHNDREAESSPAKRDPLYCRACKKQFAKQTVFDAHLKGRKHIRAQAELDVLSAPHSSQFAATAAAALPSTIATHVQQMHDVAIIEYCIHQYAQLMDGQLQATIAFQQHKLTLTPAELQHEIQHTLRSTTQPASTALILASSAAAGGHGDSSSAMEEDELPPSLANPKHLPLGPDGKPIPYWVYKLQGLNHFFTCEVCGDYKYRGPKEYQEHFSGWRHAWGMKCIGLPNARELWGVTSIEQVKALWETMRQHEQGRGWREDEEEEMEDSEGNVFNKKTYLELQRQGLI